MAKLLDRCEAALTYVAVVATLLMMGLTVADAGGRYLFNYPITAAFEITSEYLMVAAIFLGMTYAYREGANIRVTFLVGRLPAPVKLVLNYLVQGFSMVLGMLLVVATTKQAIRSIMTGTKLSSVDFPLGPAYMIVPVGLFLTSLWMLFDLRQVRKGKSSLLREESPDA